MGPVQTTAVNDAATKLAGFIESLSREEQVAIVQIMSDVIQRTQQFPSAAAAKGMLSSWVRSGRTVAAGW